MIANQMQKSIIIIREINDILKSLKNAIDTRHIPRRGVIFKNPLLLVFFVFVKEL